MLRLVVVAAASLVAGAGCAELHPPRAPVSPAGLLTDPALLNPGPAQGPVLVYVAPDSDLSHYGRIMLDPVTVWRGHQGSAAAPSQANAQILADALYTILYDELSQDYLIVSEPGADTLRLQAGLGPPDDRAPGLAVISTRIPQMRLITQLQRLPQDGSAFGGAAFEVRVLDSESGQLLEASVDRWPNHPIGDGEEAGPSAERALQAWSRLLRERLCLARGADCGADQV